MRRGEMAMENKWKREKGIHGARYLDCLCLDPKLPPINIGRPNPTSPSPSPSPFESCRQNSSRSHPFRMKSRALGRSGTGLEDRSRK